MKKIHYALDYNNARGLAHWVAYELTSEEAQAPRKKRGSHWINDPLLENAPNQKVYAGAKSSIGIERGHLIPRRDSHWSDAYLNASYEMGNCSPQFDSLNNGPWKHLEGQVNQWAQRFGKVYIIAGPLLESQGRLKEQIDIPTGYWKTVLRTLPDTAGIAFVIPNERKPLNRYLDYRVSVDSVEAQIKLDLFHQLPKSLQELIESNTDSNWPE